MTQPPVETNDVVERGKAIMALFGSFWLNLHQDKSLFHGYGRGLGELMAQRMTAFLYSVATLSRETMPVFWNYVWSRVVVRQSELNTSNAGALKYGDAGVEFAVGSDTAHLYGGRGDYAVKELDVSQTLQHISVLTNTPVSPSEVLTGGTDFWVDADNAALVFRTDPFLNTRMPVVEILDNSGQIVDREITLWAYNSLHDLHDMSNRFGAVVGLKSSSSNDFNVLVNSVFHCLSAGPSLSAVRSLFCGLSGVTPVRTTGERVVDIQTTASAKIVATDTGVYRCPLASNVVVSVGDVLSAGDIVCDSVQILCTPDAMNSLEGLLLDRRWCVSLHGALGFPNEDLPLLLDTVGGKTRISAALLGDPKHARSFWDAVHGRGVAAGRTLANALDLRDSPAGEPTIEDLPKTLNPMKLLLSEMRGSLMVVKLRSDAFSTTAPNVSMGHLLDFLIPARLACLVLVETTKNIEYIGLTDTADEDVPGGADSLYLGYSVYGPLTDSIDSTASLGSAEVGMTDAGPFAWIVKDPCGQG